MSIGVIRLVAGTIGVRIVVSVVSVGVSIWSIGVAGDIKIIRVGVDIDTGVEGDITIVGVMVAIIREGSITEISEVRV